MKLSYVVHNSSVVSHSKEISVGGELVTVVRTYNFAELVPAEAESESGTIKFMVPRTSDGLILVPGDIVHVTFEKAP